MLNPNLRNELFNFELSPPNHKWNDLKSAVKVQKKLKTFKFVVGSFLLLTMLSTLLISFGIVNTKNSQLTISIPKRYQKNITHRKTDYKENELTPHMAQTNTTSKKEKFPNRQSQDKSNHNVINTIKTSPKNTKHKEKAVTKNVKSIETQPISIILFNSGKVEYPLLKNKNIEKLPLKSPVSFAHSNILKHDIDSFSNQPKPRVNSFLDSANVRVYWDLLSYYKNMAIENSSEFTLMNVGMYVGEHFHLGSDVRISIKDNYFSKVESLAEAKSHIYMKVGVSTGYNLTPRRKINIDPYINTGFVTFSYYDNRLSDHYSGDIFNYVVIGNRFAINLDKSWRFGINVGYQFSSKVDFDSSPITGKDFSGPIIGINFQCHQTYWKKKKMKHPMLGEIEILRPE